MTRPRRRRPPATARPTAEPLENRAYFATGLTFGKVNSISAGPNPAEVLTADLNGNGQADVIVANYGLSGTGGISTLLGTGDGSTPFSKYQFYPINTPIQSIAVGDLNGDGLPDVVGVGYYQPYVYVWMNKGDGTLATPFAVPVGAHPEGVAIADVNGDHIPDIITVNQGAVGLGSISVLVGQGQGKFATTPVSYDGGPNPDALAVSDVNGDGYPDIVTVDPENDEIHVLLNNGTKGTTTTTTDPSTGATTITNTGQFPATNTAYLTDTTGRAVTIADVNNDGRPDLIVANLRASSVGVFLNATDGTFQSEATYGVGGFPFSVTVADLNNDNRPEIITADSRENAVGVLVHNNQGGFNTGGGTGAKNDGTTQPRQFLTGTSPEDVAVADVNGDGMPDLITADFNTNSIGVLLNNTKFIPNPLTTTTLTLTASLPTTAGAITVQSASPVTLTATLTPAPDPARFGGRKVVFLEGDRVLGDANLAADGTATLQTRFVLPAKVSSETVSVTAQYSGNAYYYGSTGTLGVTVLPKATPLVTATGVVVTSRAGRYGGGSTTLSSIPLPAAPTTTVATTQGGLITATAVALVAQSTTPFVPGDTGAVAVTISNESESRQTGYVAVDLSAQPTAGTMTKIPLTTLGSATFGVDIRSGYANVVPVVFRLPAVLAAGGYSIVATLARARATFAAGQVDTTTAATTASPVTVVSVLVPLTPGDTGTAAVTIANQGAGQATGSVAVSMQITSVADPSLTVAAPIVGPDTFALNLIGGTSRTVPVKFTVPASLAAGDYTVSAALTPSTNLDKTTVDSTPTTTVNPTTIATAFGTVPSGRKGVAVTAALPNGSNVNLSLTGPGSGTLTVTGESAVLTLANTSAATALNVTLAGTVPAVLTQIVDNYRLGSINAPNVTIAGDATSGIGALSLATGVNTVTLAGLSDADVNNGPRGHAALSLGTVNDVALSSASSLASLTVNSWSATSGDVIEAPAILGAVTSAGDFGAMMILAGGGQHVALGSVSIGGTVASTSWVVGSSVGAISIAGDLDDVEILAGARHVVTRNDPSGYYVFNAARIASVTVGGNVIGSFVAAGFRPTTNLTPPFDPTGGTVLPGGSIGAITVTGTVDAASRFAAASLPAIG